MDDILRHFESGTIDELIETARVSIEMEEDREDRIAKINDITQQIDFMRREMVTNVTAMFVEVDANNDGFIDK